MNSLCQISGGVSWFLQLQVDNRIKGHGIWNQTPTFESPLSVVDQPWARCLTLLTFSYLTREWNNTYLRVVVRLKGNI